MLVLRKGEGEEPEELPDGFEDLADYNLISYKSHQQVLDDWAMDELVAYYVGYRKMVSPEEELLPEDRFRLYAISTWFPESLSEQVPLEQYKEGIYDVKWGSLNIRVIVLSQVSDDRKNALWHIFSAVPDSVVRGAAAYKEKDRSNVMGTVFEKYNTEGIAIPCAVEDL
jgi:hypothetical protein